MKIAGLDPTTFAVEEVLVLPRGDQNIVFRAKGVPNMDEFHKFVPEPKAPGVFTRDGWKPNEEDGHYRTALTEYQRRRLAYIVVKSLEPSEIEWDTVDMDNPSTWPNWELDLQNVGFSQVECNRVLGLCMEANCLDEAKLKKAREVFLRGPMATPAA